MAERATTFPIGKFASAVVLVALTALPLVSCGPIVFRGHEILRNVPPDTEGFTRPFKEIGDAFGKIGEGFEEAAAEVGGGPDGAEVPTRPEPPSKPKSKDREHLFEGSGIWMRWLYVAVVLLAFATLFLRSGSRASRTAAGVGLAGLLVFLLFFEKVLRGDAGEDSGSATVLDWDTGAYLAVAGFALLLFMSARPERAPDRAVGPRPEAEPPP